MSKTYTVRGKTDGFGAQFLAIMSGIVYCKYNNYIYIHTPLTNVGFNQNAKLLNNFIGIPSSPNQENIDIIEPFSKEVHYCDKPSKYYTEEAIKILKNYYYSTPKPDIENIDIAIHIRRGDVNNTAHPGRYNKNSDYIKIIKYLNKKYPKYSITIFSEGITEDFDELNDMNLSFKLNLNIMETFHSLVSAKILVTAKSTFSYSAAILNSNKIYYMYCFHNPLDHWETISYEGV